MNSIEVLDQIFKSFNMFSDDFKQKETTINLNIYYALDNDIFDLALMPFKKDNLKYADLFEDFEGLEHSFLEQQARQLAYALRYMVERKSIVILPSYSMEYKDTIFHLFKSIEKLRYSATNNKIIEKEHQNIIDKLNKIEGDELISLLKKDAPELLNVLETFNEISFSTKQLQIIMSNSKNIDSISDIEIDINDSLPQNIINHLKKYKEKKGRKKENIKNDVIALKTIVAYNKVNTNKKLVLLTGDNGIIEAYNNYDANYDINDIYSVRHPKYLIPFITKYNSLYSNQNKETLKKIDNLFKEFFNDFEVEKMETAKENAKNVIRSLKNILNLRDIEEFSMNEIENPVSKYDIAKLKDKHFLTKLKESIAEEKERLLGSISLTPALTELLHSHSDFSQQKVHHRLPFVIEAEDYVQQSKIDDFTTKTFKSNNIINDIVNLDQFFNINYIQLICSVVMNFIDKKDVALKYIEYTRKEISSSDSHILNESYLLEVFIRRTSNINDNGISEILSILDNKLKQPTKTQLLRKNIGKVSILITKQYIDYFDSGKINKKELLKLNKSLENLLNEYNSVFEYESLLKERAKVQIYMNIVSLYLFETIFLQHEISTEKKEFFKKNKSIYENLKINLDGENDRFIPYRNILINFLLLIVLPNEEDFVLKLKIQGLKNSIKSQISDTNIYIMDYERKRFNGLLQYIEKY